MSRKKGAKLKREQRDVVLKKKHWKSQPVFKPQKGQKKPRKPHQQHTQPVIPFNVHDKILLVGEGDCSFAASLITQHGCADVLTTCFDAEANVKSKYPEAQSHTETILAAIPSSIMYAVDATKLSTQHKRIRTAAPFDRIMFNFPHVGGKSTDVNRQVRYNQALLSGFFGTAKELLAAKGSILVTLFEGEPYTLWNVRDLARHAELVVLRSFKFRPEVYPGYSHARTIGAVRMEKGDGAVSRTAWKGEHREARTYEFCLKGGEPATPKKNKGGESSSGEEDGDD